MQEVDSRHEGMSEMGIMVHVEIDKMGKRIQNYEYGEIDENSE